MLLTTFYALTLIIHDNTNTFHVIILMRYFGDLDYLAMRAVD
jgi:hypothetical protein